MMPPAEYANLASAEETFWWFRGMRQITFAAAAPHLNGRANWKVLEAGCGTGYFAKCLEQERGWRLFPVDVSPEGLRYARALGLQRALQADIARLPFPHASFDAALCLDVLVHARPGEEAALLAELHRVLLPGGLLILRAAALNALRSRHSQFVGERQRFTRRRLSRALTQSGFRILRSTYANSLLLPVALFKFRLWEPLMRRPPASGLTPLPGWLDRILFHCLRAEARWLARGRNLPLGQSLILIAEKATS